jgi:DNA-binding XRE family transcriptional regulator
LHIEPLAYEMTVDLVDRHAIANLRKMCKLEPARLARMADLTVQQITQLEEGGVSAFSSVESKIQAALKVASIMSGVQENGMPVVNVFHSSKAKASQMGMAVTYHAPRGKPAKPKYPDSPEFYKMLLIFLVLAFLLVAVAMPLLFAIPSQSNLDPTVTVRPINN